MVLTGVSYSERSDARLPGLQNHEEKKKVSLTQKVRWGCLLLETVFQNQND